MPLTAEQRATATTELEQLQSVIARHEGYTFTIRGWLFAVVSALTAAAYTPTIGLPVAAYGILTLTLIVFFLIWELIQRAPKRRAINRVLTVEEFLRNDKNYEGPYIAKSLASGDYHWLSEVKIHLMWVPYALAVAFVVGAWAIHATLPAHKDETTQALEKRIEKLEAAMNARFAVLEASLQGRIDSAVDSVVKRRADEIHAVKQPTTPANKP